MTASQINSSGEIDRFRLVQAVGDQFNESEVRTLCFALDVDYDDLPSAGKAGKVRELVALCLRISRLEEFLNLLSHERPHHNWEQYLRSLDEYPSPFKGLQYYDIQDAHLFFGREKWTETLVSRLEKSLDPKSPSFLAVVGASGSGKSSLVRAGLIPALQTTPPLIDGDAGWSVHLFTPTAHPLKALATSLTREAESVTVTATLMDDLAQTPRCLDLFAHRLVSQVSARRLLVVVDQFEEIFTQCRDEIERKAFINNLLTAIEPELAGPVVVVITLRADFYHHCAVYERLRQLLAERQEYIGPMSQNELRLAIEEPARSNSYSFEEGLVERLLHDVGEEPGNLPLLSHVLHETWRRREGRNLTHRGYQKAGEVRSAIARTADSVYESFDANEQATARSIFLRLTELGEGTEDTRRRASPEELVTGPQQAKMVTTTLQKLIDARLIIVDQESVEVAHEALIREWPRLRSWLEENREGLRLHRQLNDAAQDWLELERDPGALYRGARLAQALEWKAEYGRELNELERKFLDQSQTVLQAEAEQREAVRQRELEHARELAEAEAKRADVQSRSARRLRIGAILLLVALSAAIIAAILAIDARTAAESESLDRATAVAKAEAAADAEAGARLLAQQNADMAATVAAEVELAKATSDANYALAVTAAEQADMEARLATSRRLAAQAVSQRSSDPSLSLLLGIEAFETANTYEARDVVLGNLTFSPLLDTFLHGHEAYASSIAFGPDGRFLATGSCSLIYFGVDISFCGQGEIRVWDAASRRELAVLHPSIDTDTLYAAINNVTFSHDSRFIASSDEGGGIYLWNTSDWQLVQEFWGPFAYRNNIIFSQDDKILAASGSLDGHIHFWDLDSGVKINEIEVPVAGYNAPPIAFSPRFTDGRIVAIGSDRDIIIYDTEDWEIFSSTATEHDSAITSLAYSPDGQLRVTGDEDGSIIFFAVNEGPLESPIKEHQSAIISLAFSPDGRYMASSGEDNKILLWDVAERRPIGIPLVGHTDIVNQIAFSPDGQIMGSAASNLYLPRDNRIILWNLSAYQSLSTAANVDLSEIHKLAFSPDGGLMAIGGPGEIILWDPVERVQIEKMVTGNSNRITALTFSPDGKTLASGESGGRLTLWDIAGRQAVFENVDDGERSKITDIAFDPKGQTLAVYNGPMARVTIWTLNGQPKLDEILEVPLADFSGRVVFGSDGHSLAVGGGQGLVIVDQAAGGETVSLPVIGKTESVLGVADVRDDIRTYVAVGSTDRTLSVQALSSGKQIGPVMRRPNTVITALFSPDGTLLASGEDTTLGALEEDPSLVLWDVSTMAQLGFPLVGHEQSIQDLVFSPNGDQLYSGDLSGQLLVWDLDINDWIESSCLIANRNLTKSEWDQFIGPDLPYRLTCPDLPSGLNEDQ